MRDIFRHRHIPPLTDLLPTTTAESIFHLKGPLEGA